MTLADYYLTYLKELGEGTRKPPEGIVLTQSEPMARAAELQTEIGKIGVPEFVRRCAAQDGTAIPEALYEQYSDASLMEALASAVQPSETAEEAEKAPQETADDPLQPPQIDEPDGPRSAYEVLLDCCCLDEKLLYYFIDVCKRGAEEEFQKLALVTARKAFTMQDFLYWLATREQRAERDELICVTLMDACFDRLAAEGQKELIAALLCGDQKTFELFRCDAPELLHLPEATFDWYAEHYLRNYYPLRYILRFNGVRFPTVS